MTNLINTFLQNSIGFDPFFDGIDNWISPRSSFPFHNIKKESDNKYVIEMALAGYSKEDINIHQTDEILTIEATDAVAEKSKKEDYISKGISKRWFRKQFQLADTVKVVKVKLENGMLHINLECNRPTVDKTFDID
jgi:molecular chaperone IbpA